MGMECLDANDPRFRAKHATALLHTRHYSRMTITGGIGRDFTCTSHVIPLQTMALLGFAFAKCVAIRLFIAGTLTSTIENIFLSFYAINLLELTSAFIAVSSFIRPTGSSLLLLSSPTTGLPAPIFTLFCCFF